VLSIRHACRHTALPDFERLEAVHHRTIVTIGGTGDNDEHQADVVSPQTSVSKPVDLGELASRKAEVTFSWGLHFDCLWCGEERLLCTEREKGSAIAIDACETVEWSAWLIKSWG
jgi:hypothetical protein